MEYLKPDEIDLALRLLTRPNRLAMKLCIATGLRISDALGLRTDQLKGRVTIRERKTGKSRRVTIPAKLLEELRQSAGAVYVWPNAKDPNRHRTRQAVWKDVKRAAKAARVPANAGTHSARKVYAVEKYRRGGLEAAQSALLHDDPTVTMLYALADQLRAAGPPPRRRSKKLDVKSKT